VREVVIVISDLYLSQETPERQLPDGVALPGLEHVGRFGRRSTVEGGWRRWLARRLNGEGEVAAAAAATVASLALNSRVAGMVWMATPVHLIAGLTSLHLDRRSVLHLPAADLAALKSDFDRTFADSGFALRPVDSGDFLLLGPEMPLADTLEPARSMGESIADGMRGGNGAPALRRLGAEIEMWLHDHPLNDARKSRGDLPVTGLWLWGAGPVGVTLSSKRREPAIPVPKPETAEGQQSDARILDSARSADIVFGSDAYLQGLCVHLDTNVLSVPPQLTDIFSYPRAKRAVLVIEIAPMLHSKTTWTFFDALMQIDRSFITPAVEALNDGQFEQLVIVANDHELTHHARGRFKLWRRPQPGLLGLQ
jgi:hypothetical protein